MEFGWIGGLLFGALVLIALLRMWPLSFEDAGAQFALSSLVFTFIASMVHGQLEAEASLYLFLGLSAAYVNRYKSKRIENFPAT